MESYLISLIVSYFLGSIPTAYLVVKSASDIDIRKAGSGNVGGRNALEVTGKKWVGAVVTAIDLFKGMAAVGIALFFEDRSMSVPAAMFGAVTGHCYPVWLKFHGGRGLATGAGTLFLTGWVWVPLWLALYFGSERITKNVHASSVIALVGLPLLTWSLPENIVALMLPGFLSVKDFFAAGCLVVAVCLARHIEPMQEYFHEKKS